MSQYSQWGWIYRQFANWKRDLQAIVYQAHTLSIALRHPLVPWRAKLAASVGIGYIFSPIQLIPTFIPVIGQLDDLCVLYVAMKLVRKITPPDVMAQCEARAMNKIGGEQLHKIDKTIRTAWHQRLLPICKPRVTDPQPQATAHEREFLPLGVGLTKSRALPISASTALSCSSDPNLCPSQRLPNQIRFLDLAK